MDFSLPEDVESPAAPEVVAAPAAEVAAPVVAAPVAPAPVATAPVVDTTERDRLIEEAALGRAIRDGRVVLPTPAAPASPEAPKLPFGVESPDQMYSKLPEILGQLHDANEKLRIQQEAADTWQQQQQGAYIQQVVNRAREAGRLLTSDKITPELWEEFMPTMVGFIKQYEVEHRAYEPEIWKWAAERCHLDKIAAAIAPAPKVEVRTAGAPAIGNAAPGAAPVVTTADTPTTGNKGDDDYTKELTAMMNKGAKENGRKTIDPNRAIARVVDLRTRKVAAK